MNTHETSRRDFLKKTGIAATVFSVGSQSLFGEAHSGAPAATAGTPDLLNVACIGIGGRGRGAVQAMAEENLIGLCDVDEERASASRGEHPGVPFWRDYREMLHAIGDRLDGVTISTPDHSHFPAAMLAMSMGLHVYVEKPLTHTIAEARMLRMAARKAGVVTQMGNQGHSGEGVRNLREWVQGGVLGHVREVHSWTNRPIWPQGLSAPDHSECIPVVPETLDWDLWLGPAPEVAYDPAYAPFSWRGYWDYGTGALGDMACHIMDGAFWALDLGYPDSVEAVAAHVNDVSAPEASMITFRFPARNGMPPVKYVWYDGQLRPPRPAVITEEGRWPSNGSLIVGDEATVLADTYYGNTRIVPEPRFRELIPGLPEKTIPRVKGGPFKEWTDAIRAGTQPGSNFEYSGPLTEMCLLGNLAVRSQRALTWDGVAMKVTDWDSANQWVSKPYRKGWDFTGVL